GQPLELAAGARRARVVVEEGEGLLRLPRELAERLDPLLQLVPPVEVVEALRGASAALVPGLRVPPMEADVGDRAREGDDRRDDVPRALDARRVDDDERRAEVLEEAQRLRPRPLLEPARLPELAAHLVA